MTIDEIIRSWREPDFSGRLDPDAVGNPAGNVALLDHEIAPARIQIWAGTCEDLCGDTCPGRCNNTCFSASVCCC